MGKDWKQKLHLLEFLWRLVQIYCLSLVVGAFPLRAEIFNYMFAHFNKSHHRPALISRSSAIQPRAGRRDTGSFGVVVVVAADRSYP